MNTLLLSTDPSGRGGIATVIADYERAGLMDGRVAHVATHREGGRLMKVGVMFAAYVRFLRILLSRSRPGTVHAHVASRGSFYRKSLFLLTAMGWRRRTILHLHGAEFDAFIHGESSRVGRWFARWLLCNVDEVVVLSDRWREWMCAFTQREDIHVIPNFVVEVATNPAVERSGAVFLGEFSKRKGIPELVEAWAGSEALKAQRLNLYGLDRGVLAECSAGLCAAQGSIVVNDWVSGDAKNRAIAGARVLVLPSHAEGAPMAILEAMSSGIPIVASSVGGIPDQVEHERGGLLVPPGDPVSLRAALERILGDRSLAERMGAFNRQRYLDAFSPHAVLGKLRHLYSQSRASSPTTIASVLLGAARSYRFAGYDPFDGLNSRLLTWTRLDRIAFLRLAWLQLCKRSPINLRPLALVPRSRNPKGIALFILGLLEDYRRTGETAYLAEAKELANWLLTQRSSVSEWSHACWGYNFDWQARAFFVPAGKPNVVTTLYVANALLALAEIDGDARWREIALDAGRFVSAHLFVENGEESFFAYIPGEATLVHNANLWACVLAARVAVADDDTALRERVLRAIRTSVRAQREDGAWPYGTRHHHQFVDGFHTGFNLEALRILGDVLGTKEWDASVASGFAYYKKSFFTPGGDAKYYASQLYPIDMHSVAQGVVTLVKLGGDADHELAKQIVGRAIETMFLPGKARFAYQSGRFLRNRVDYLRWTQAWSYYALAMFNRKETEMACA